MRTLLPFRKRLLDLGLGHSDYTRFVVLGRSRVGSNLLRSLLNAHPQAVAFGEVFRDPNDMDWDHVGYFQSASDRRLIQRDPVRFMERRLLGRYPHDFKAVGFKLFYYHARTGAHAGLWPWLIDRRAIRVIHLKRENLLETHVSRKRAVVSGKWVSTSGRADEAVALRLDYDEVLADFERTRASETECDRVFAGHPLLQVTYEQLAADVPAETKRIAEFLEVTPHPVKPSTSRQSAMPLSETVSNYHELKSRFAGSPWAAFFID